jgi:hypothetical protein
VAQLQFGELTVTVTVWPPTEDYGRECPWCPHCAFPLSRADMHRGCIGYIVGTPDLALCSCPCNAQRRERAKLRKPSSTDQDGWWKKLPDWKPA